MGYFYFREILQKENNHFTILEKIIKDKCNSILSYNIGDLLEIESMNDSTYGHSLVILFKTVNIRWKCCYKIWRLRGKDNA